MIHLIKAQLKYFIYNHDFFNNIFFFSVILGFALGYKVNDGILINAIFFFSFSYYSILVIFNTRKENRYRIICSLPLSANKVAFVRIILVIIGFITILSILSLINFYSPSVNNNFSDSFAEISTFSVFFMSGIFLYAIFSDIFSNEGEIKRFIIGSILIAIIVTIILSLYFVWNISLKSIIINLSPIWIIILFAITSALLSVLSFKKRTTFLSIE